MSNNKLLNIQEDLTYDSGEFRSIKYPVKQKYISEFSTYRNKIKLIFFVASILNYS